MADKLERDIEMALGFAEEGANVTLNTDMQLVIKQRTEEFLVTLDQALTASRRSTRPSGKIEEDEDRPSGKIEEEQEGEEEADSQPRTRVAESQEGRTDRSKDAQEAKYLDEAMTTTRGSIRPSERGEEDEEREEKEDF